MAGKAVFDQDWPDLCLEELRIVRTRRPGAGGQQSDPEHEGPQTHITHTS
jgi:hypothetical protein